MKLDDFFKKAKAVYEDAPVECPSCGYNECKQTGGNFYQCEKCGMTFNKVPPLVPGYTGCTG